MHDSCAVNCSAELCCVVLYSGIYPPGEYITTGSPTSVSWGLVMHPTRPSLLRTLLGEYLSSVFLLLPRPRVYILREGPRTWSIGWYMTAALHCTVLCCAVAVQCTVLYWTVVYSTLLHCTVLYYAVLCCAVLCTVDSRCTRRLLNICDQDTAQSTVQLL